MAGRRGRHVALGSSVSFGNAKLLVVVPPRASRRCQLIPQRNITKQSAAMRRDALNQKYARITCLASFYVLTYTADVDDLIFSASTNPN